MPIVDRKSYEDSRNVVEQLLPDRPIRKKLLEFLSSAIIYANGLKSDNWSLNLDKQGKFIRFNVGQVYCVQISRGEVLILGLKTALKAELADRNLEIEFVGYKGLGKDKEKVLSHSLQAVPDCLARVPDSVACIVAHENIIPYLRVANQHFISYAIDNTTQLPPMKKAHSVGFIEYLSKFNSKYISNPTYAISEEKFYLYQETENFSEGTVHQHTVNLYERSRTARKKCIEYYGAICSICGFDFGKVYGPLGKDYMEVHHLKPLSEINETYQVDPVNDLRPVCPNCHAMIHRKDPPLSIEQVKDSLARYGCPASADSRCCLRGRNRDGL